MVHIESRLSKSEKHRYEFYVDCKAKTKEQLLKAIEKLKEKSTYLHMFNKQNTNTEFDEGG